ncbi:transglutaminase [Actinorhabdospora filicis]|uniref:Transglutaminase n=1 Tax=Actinorhabdospora filicis TaxID=1785913 RepID=A0A9W6SHD8_9ACTN|nr:transglutaminase domain-containing protein [Actinorhabdospora filicis]GLZ76033.1 transglutaminase [Actinorhabdospora filicis]
MNRLRAFAVPLTLVGTIVMAGSALGRIYVNELLVYLVAGAAVLSVTVGALLRNRSAALLPPIHIALLFGYTILCVRFTAGRATVDGTFTDIYLDAVRNSVPRLLTSMIPVEPQPDTVLVPVVATWAVGLLAAEFGVRYRRVLLGYLPPVALYGFSLYLVGPNAAGSVWYGLGFAGLAGLGLAASAVEPETEGTVIRADRKVRMRAITTGAAGAAVLIAAVAALGPLAGGAVTGKPSDPREYVVPPQLTDVDSNPLIRMSGWAQNPDQPLFSTKMSADARLRLAVLSDYDGVTWKIGQTYRAAGRVLTPPDSTVAPTSEITQKITIGELTGRLTPSVPDPVLVDGMRVAYDKETGTLMNPAGLVRGETYTVTSQLPAPQVNKLATASVGSGEPVARFLALPGQLPEEITRLAEYITEQGGGPYQRATNLETFLSTHYAFNAKAASGHSLPNLKFFLGTPPRGGGQQGTSEQFAAAFGVVARKVGLPTRVIVGFRSSAGDYTVRGGDAIAWPEVYFQNIGWVAFNPMPQPDETITPPEDEIKPPEETKPPSSSAPPQNYDDPAASAPSDSGQAAPGATSSQGGAIPAWVFAAGSAAVILLACVITVLTMKRARTQRRLWTGDAAARVRGAWRETYDAMRQARRRPPPSLTATEVAGYATEALGGRPGPSLASLVDAVNEVTFAPAAVRPESAEAAARAAQAYTAALRAARPGWRRLLWTLTPRPLFWTDAPLPKTDR